MKQDNIESLYLLAFREGVYPEPTPDFGLAMGHRQGDENVRKYVRTASSL
jgi:hypothetical protein